MKVLEKIKDSIENVLKRTDENYVKKYRETSKISDPKAKKWVELQKKHLEMVKEYSELKKKKDSYLIESHKITVPVYVVKKTRFFKEE